MTSHSEIKKLLTSAQVMAYFDPTKETQLITDALPTGLSAILLQTTPDTKETRVVAYVSRTLSAVECRYSQTEREALAIVWAMRSFIFTFVEVILSSLLTASICSLSITTQSQNLQHELNDGISDYKVMILRPYTPEVTAIPQTISSDYLSRHSSLREEDTTLAEEYVNFISSNAVPKAMTLAEIQHATTQDKTLQCVIRLNMKVHYN